MPTLRETAEALVACCRENRTEEGLRTLYHPDAVSVEAMAMPGSGSRETHGLDGIRGKHEWWFANHDVHEATAEGPFLHGDDRFGVIFGMDVTFRGDGTRHVMKELGIYTVNAEGRITREEFFYTM